LILYPKFQFLQNFSYQVNFISLFQLTIANFTVFRQFWGFVGQFWDFTEKILGGGKFGFAKFDGFLKNA
jgi:hypothetical protein